jgi:single-strand DNA-binding protein
MNIVYFTGNIGKDAETRDTSKGSVCSFSVAVRQGTSRDAQSEWYRCSIWGQRGQNLASYLVKGAKVSAVGVLEIGEYNDKPQYNVNVLEIDPFCGGKAEGKPAAQTGGSSASTWDDDSDSIPF